MFLDDVLPNDLAARAWHQAFKENWLRNSNAPQLDALLKSIAHRTRTPPNVIAFILMGFRHRTSGFDNRIIVYYAASLLRTRIISSAHLLSALLKRSRFVKIRGKPQPATHCTNAPTLEEMLFTLMFHFHLPGTEGEITLKVRDTPQLLPILTRWLQVVTEHEMVQQVEQSNLHVVDPLHFSMYEALASLSLTIFNSAAVRQVMRESWWKEQKLTVVTGIQNFDIHVLQWINSRFANSFSTITKLPPFLDVDENGRPMFTEQQVMESITDLPIAQSRAGLYIWVNACLCGRPFTDDMSMLAYLQARHPGDNQSLAVDLQVAAFDALTNSLLRKESRQSIHLVRSFVCNKVPHLLVMLAGFMAPMAVEACVQMAFISITVDVLPPISAGATQVREMLKRTRLEYLQACALHGLVSENVIGIISQEQNMTLPKVTRYTKDGLVAQCDNNLGRLDSLAEELHTMQGNAGAIVACIVSMIRTFCASKDTMSLKTTCNTLIKRLSEMDIVVLFTQPSSIIGPLCLLLNTWVHDQDQTEFTPSYEEFASILLFVLVFVHRYGLEKVDLGLPSGTDGFIYQLLRDFSSSIPPPQLTTEQNAQLSKWVEGLFSIDEHGETSIISDEVMRHCPPQAFYLLVPTLFEQSVLACKANALSISTFKGGLELLLEPWLLPSLVGGLTWLVKHSWEDHGDVHILIQMLDKLLKPSSQAQETLAMHKAVLSIVADPLMRFLQDLTRKRAAKKDINNLTELLKPHCGQRRVHSTALTDVKEWIAGANSGLSSRLRSSISDMVAWTSSIGHSPPTRYTHLLFTTALQMLGAVGVLKAVIAELREQSALNNGPVALDICAAMICAPYPAFPGLTLTALPDAVSSGAGAALSVRDTLKLVISDTKVFMTRPASEAEAIVRLHRRVEAQMAVAPVPQMPLSTPTQDEATKQIIKDLGLEETASGTALIGQTTGTDFITDDLVVGLENPINIEAASNEISNLGTNHNAMDIDFNDLGMSLDQPPGTGMNNGEQSAEDDIFAGLDMNVGDLGDDDFPYN